MKIVFKAKLAQVQEPIRIGEYFITNMILKQEAVIDQSGAKLGKDQVYKAQMFRLWNAPDITPGLKNMVNRKVNVSAFLNGNHVLKEGKDIYYCNMVVKEINLV